MPSLAFLKKTKLRSEIRACLQLAIPLAAAQLAQQATSFVDTVMMGLLGSEAIAAGGLGGISFGTLLLVCSGTISAVSPLIAEAYGQSNTSEHHSRDRIERVAQQGLWLALMIAIPATLLLWNADLILGHLGQQPDTIALVVSYLRAIAWGLFPALAFTVLRNVVSALSHPRPIMVITLCGLAFNVAANYVLMFGKLGLPPMGLAGIGWASTLSFWGVLLALTAYIQRQPLRQFKILPSRLQFDFKILRELLRIGIPIAVLYGVETGLFTIATYLMGYLGTVPLAAHQIALQTSAITFMVPAGISYATTVRVGQLLGQENLSQARLAAFINLAISATFMGAMGLLLLTLPRSIVALYLDVDNPANAAVVAMAIDLLRVAALFQLVDGIQIVAAGALRGLQDTRTPMLIGLFAYWGVGLSCGYTLCFRLGWGGVGLWIGLAIGLAIAATIFTLRFTRLIHQRIQYVR